MGIPMVQMWLLLISVAAAVDVDSFQPTGAAMDGRGGLQVGGADVGASGDGYVATWLVYARDPVVESWPDGAEAPVVSDLFATWVAGGATIAGALRVDASLALYPYVSAPGVPYEGGSVGDLRVDATVPLLRGDSFGLAVVPGLSLPTGRATALTSTGGPGARLGLVGEVGAAARFVGRGRLGVEARPADTLADLEVGSVLMGGLGGAFRPQAGVEVGAELTGSLDLLRLNPSASPVEAHVYGSLVPRSGLAVMVGAGTGLLAGIGAPEVRVFLGVGYHDAGRRDGAAARPAGQAETPPAPR